MWHLLLPVSDGWGSGTTSRFSIGELTERVDVINAEGGAVTFDVPIAADGAVPNKILRTLRKLGDNIESLRDGVRSD